MSVNPAKLLGIPGGKVEIDGIADLFIADLDKEWTVEPQKLHSKSKNSVFKEANLKGKVLCTICNGQITYREGI